MTAAPRTVTGAAARAAAFSMLSSAVAAGLHHATADSPVTWSRLTLAAVVMFLGIFPALLLESRQAVTVVAVTVQAVVPTWLNATKTADAPDGHYRLPAAWHHNGPAMALLNIAVALALAWLLNRAYALPAQLLRACITPGRQFTALVSTALGLLTPQPYDPAPPGRHAFVLRKLSSQTAHLTLRHQRVPCGP